MYHFFGSGQIPSLSIINKLNGNKSKYVHKSFAETVFHYVGQPSFCPGIVDPPCLVQPIDQSVAISDQTSKVKDQIF